MKIFANQFALSLGLEPILPAVHMETLTFEEAQQQLLSGAPLFPGQVIRAHAQPGAHFVHRVYDLHTRPEVGLLPAELVLVFEKEKDRKVFWESYQELYKPMRAAGGLVTNAAGELLLIYRHEQWDLPKGKLEKGEKLAEAAWREVAEETGVKSHRLGDKMAETWHIFRRNSGWTLKETHWWEMPTSAKENLEPQLEESITAIEWWSVEKLTHHLPETWMMVRELITRFCLKHQP